LQLRLILLTKIKSIAMQTQRIVQAVILMMIVAMAASCTASKEYTSKLFAPRVPVEKDSQAFVSGPRFLDLDADSARAEEQGWVSTDIIMGRDTITNSVALDKLSKTIPVSAPSIDTTSKTPAPSESLKTNPVMVSKPAPAETEPVAKAYNPGEVRNKKIREK
jgi:hypothetical protein